MWKSLTTQVRSLQCASKIIYLVEVCFGDFAEVHDDDDNNNNNYYYYCYYY